MVCTPIDSIRGTVAAAKQTSIRFADEDLEILDAIQARLGLFSQSDAIRHALRYRARNEGADEPKPAKATRKK